jgi:hypothetical protein
MAISRFKLFCDMMLPGYDPEVADTCLKLFHEKGYSLN